MQPASTGPKRGGGPSAVALKPVVRSCSSCRQKHKKCDGQDPCGYCVRLGQPERCLFSVPTRHGPKPTEDLETYARRLLSEIDVQKQVAQYWKGAIPQLALPPKEKNRTAPARPNLRKNRSSSFIFVSCCCRTIHVRRIGKVAVGRY
jgi:hypothetical protein